LATKNERHDQLQKVGTTLKVIGGTIGAVVKPIRLPLAVANTIIWVVCNTTEREVIYDIVGEYQTPVYEDVPPGGTIRLVRAGVKGIMYIRHINYYVDGNGDAVADGGLQHEPWEHWRDCRYAYEIDRLLPAE
jgi:hypothetical protein